MISIRYEHGRHVPRVFCDACEEVITGFGNAEWVFPSNNTEHQPVFHTHKGACSDRLRRRDPKAVWCFEELNVHFVFLLHNTSIDWREANTRADAVSDLP